MYLRDIINISDEFVNTFFDNFTNCRVYPSESDEVVSVTDNDIKDRITSGIISRESFYTRSINRQSIAAV